MSSINGEIGMQNMTDKATYERLEKDVASREKRYQRPHRPDHRRAEHSPEPREKQARRGYKQARANVDSAVDDISERGSAMMGAAQDAAASIEETLEDVITQRPLATVGLALGLGLPDRRDVAPISLGADKNRRNQATSIDRSVTGEAR